MAQFKKGYENWKNYRRLGQYMKVDFHHSDELSEGSYHENMEKVSARSLNALKTAYEKGIEYVIFTHGWSTSRRGNTTARSQVRKLMRSKDATPYIIRKECIQHYSVFDTGVDHILQIYRECNRCCIVWIIDDCIDKKLG